MPDLGERRLRNKKKGFLSSPITVAIALGLAAAVIGILIYAALLSGFRDGADKPSADSGKRSKAGIEAFKKGDFSKAIAELEEAVKANPENAENHRVLGLSYEATGKLGKAEKEYEQSLKIDPSQPEVLYNLSGINKQSGKVDKAIDQLKQALKINPNFLAAKLLLGDLYRDKGDKEKARRIYQEIIDLQPFGNIDDKAQENLEALDGEK